MLCCDLSQLYRESDSQEEKLCISCAFGSAKDTTILKKVLNFAISDELRRNSTAFVLISVGATKEGREVAWNFFKENWELFVERYPVSC